MIKIFEKIVIAELLVQILKEDHRRMLEFPQI